jgi:hypothetical protein
MKNHLYKAALLAALGLALSPVANAADLYVGFNDYLGTTASGPDQGKDYVIDLGAYTDFTVNSTFSGAINSGSFTSAFSGDANALNDVAVGAVAGGAKSGGTYLYATGSPSTALGATAYANAESSASSVPTGVYAAAGSASNPTWDYLVASSPVVGDESGNGVASEVGNPESYLANGDITLTLWGATKGTFGSPTAFSELGTLAIDANSTGAGADTITFTGADVTPAPEPTTYGIFAGVGLLGLALRRQFAAKVA